MNNLECTCKFCNTVFLRRKSDVVRRKGRPLACSHECDYLYRKANELIIEVECNNCKKLFSKKQCHVTKNNFCCRSCSATYHNKNKTKGTRVSKLEKYIQSELVSKYNFEFHFNRKDAINSELDIYVPHLRLAFELNGIFHYEPIYGDKKLGQIKNNDQLKFLACHEAKISLCVIDASNLNYFKETKAIKYLNIVTSIIDQNLSLL